MEIFKPNKNPTPCTLEHDDDFYRFSHGSTDGDYTFCGIASEEWAYTKYKTAKK